MFWGKVYVVLVIKVEELDILFGVFVFNLYSVCLFVFVWVRKSFILIWFLIIMREGGWLFFFF